MSNLKKSDWIGLGTSLVLHALVLLAFSFITMAASETQMLGYVEIEVGTFTEGRPVQKKVETPAEPQEEQPTEPTAPQQPEQTSQTPEKVELPEQQVRSEDRIDEPKQEEDVEPAPAPQEETAPSDEGGTDVEGTGGATQGTEGTGSDEQKAAPFQIEGLNRVPKYTPNPAYTEKVNATLKFRITVNPGGDVVSVIPLQKASPALERSVQEELLRNWRFNALPANAPQKNQTGFITFRFRLE